ncbi:MAG: sigma-70 family RNA polymerase sigma factor [Pirellula sp.]|jgi:RNA polymerase sigma-70 factor (ECF subfamily)|nr:sigma-70 family RNA polymerase sigma factor [Pirellula sp.]
MSDLLSTDLKSDGQMELSRLMELQRQHLRRFVECRINQKVASRLDASDIIQEVYIRAYRGLDTYLVDPEIPPLVWLRRLSKQILSEAHRKQFRQLRSPYQEQANINESFIWRIVDSGESIRTEAEKRDTAERIRSLLSQLSEIDREVLEMRHLEGYSIRDIAQLLDLTQDTIKKRYYRALSRFREIVSQCTEFADNDVEVT